MHRILLAALTAGIILNVTHVTAGPTWEISEDSWMKLSFLGQVHGSYTEDAADQEDIYLRRGRFILNGQIMDGVTFFVETDNDNAGRSGTGNVSTDIQDAFIDIQLGDSDHWVEVGLILLPFSFENRSSAASLLGLDYNAEVVKFVNHFVWRDYGAELHGHFGDRVAYCAGVFDGYDSTSNTKNPDSDFRYTGHVAVNLLGSVETGWFYSQNRLKRDAYLSVGAGIDAQQNATATTATAADGTESTTVMDSDAWVVDVQSGFALCERSFATVNAAYYNWDNGAFDGTTAFVETGLGTEKTMLTMKYSVQDPAEEERTEDYTVGLHHFLKGHNARGGIEYRWGDSNDQILAGIQFLL